MGRVIKIDTGGNQRSRLMKAVAEAVNSLSHFEELNADSLDICAFIALALLEISDTVDQTVQAWEKRGYWVKADRFQMEWSWTGNCGAQLKEAIIEGSWVKIEGIIAQISNQVISVKVPVKKRTSHLWKGAGKTLLNETEATN